MTDLTFKMELNVMEKMFPSIVEANGGIKREEELAIFKSGAKLYYRGKGMWTIGGYAHDSKDTEDAILEVLKFKRNN
jgi:hypothetical protein